MASWDPLSMAQDVIRCTLCEDAPAELNCETCQVGLCYECVSKHITSRKSSKHDLVPFIKGKSEIKLPECKSHYSIKCDFHCHQCNIPICVKCVAGSHRNHNFVEMSDTLASLKESIKQETMELEAVIAEEYEKIKTDMKAKLTKIQNEYKRLKKSIADHGKLWHQQVDIVIAQIMKNVEKMEEKDLAMLKKQLTEIENILVEVGNTAEKNKQIIQSSDATEIINHTSRNEEFQNVPTRTDLSPPTFQSLNIEAQKLSQQFGKLKSSIETELSGYRIKMKDSISYLVSIRELLDIPTEVQTINTGGDICSMTITDNNQLWIGRKDGSIDHVTIDGKSLETIKTSSESHSLGLITTKDGNLIYTNNYNHTVNLVSKGKIRTIIRTGDWIPTRLCYTSTGDLLVCLRYFLQQKITRYSDYKVKQELKSDRKENAILSFGCFHPFIAENRDQNICISDCNAQKVVVLNQELDTLQFRYDGNLASNKCKSFAPRGIATDSQSQILITDSTNHCIHIISCKGKFLRYIDNCHLQKPYLVSVDRNDQLFVAFEQAVKIIKYLK